MLDKAASSFTPRSRRPSWPWSSRPATGSVQLLGLWWLVSRSAKMLPHLERRPSHILTMVPVYIVMSFAMALVKIAALLTIRKQRWLTRDVEVSATSKRVVRTAEPAAASEARAS
jgi:hyaluronan synthase